MRPRSARLIAAALLLLGTGVASPAGAGAHPVVRTSQGACARALATPSGVYAVGDSILAGGGADLAARLSTIGRPLCFDARVSRPIAEGIAVLRAQRRLPPTVVVALGTNDALRVDDVPREIDQVMALVGRGRRVLWVDVYMQRPERLDADTAAMAAINAALRSAARRHPNLRVVEWNRKVSTRPDWMQADGLHPTRTGTRVRNVTVAQALRR